MTDTSTRPTQAEIDRAMALEEAYTAGRPLPPVRVKQAIDRMYMDWQTAGGAEKFPDLLAFIGSVAATESVTAEDRAEVRALWSWRSQPEGAPREVGHRFLAQACGESRGYQVLEDSPVGRKLESYELWDSNVQKALIKRFGLKEEHVSAAPGEVWDAASERYAEAATGQIAVFAADIGTGSILGKTEMPRVLGPKGVGREAVRFPIEFPHHEHLPADIYGLMADSAVRCELRMEDYAEVKTPAEFAAKLAAIDVPEHLQQAHAAAVARLSAANSYEELTGPSAEPVEPGLGEAEPVEPGLGEAEPVEPGLGEAEPVEPGLGEAEPVEPGLGEPEPVEPELGEPEPKQPELKEPSPAQSEARQPMPDNPFLTGVTIPRTITVPARRAPATASTHGAINPVIEAAPKSTGIEQ